MVSLFVGEFARTGWLAYRAARRRSRTVPDVGVDYYLWSLQIAGVGTTLSAINMVDHHHQDARARHDDDEDAGVLAGPRCAATCSSIAIFPVLTVAFALLLLDRYVGTQFFTNDLGGNPMLYWNLVWIWGHPEVYVLILPAFGIYSEVDLDLLRQAAVRLFVDGLRHRASSRSCPTSSGCTTSSRWARARASTPSSASRRW